MKEEVVNIEITKYEGDVYNLEVEPFHETKDDQFYLDDDTGIVIHNSYDIFNGYIIHGQPFIHSGNLIKISLTLYIS